MKKRKDIKSFIREEDWKAIKKSLLIASLWLVIWFWIWAVKAWHSNTHSSGTWTNYHSSTHANHSNHSSY